MSRLLRFLPIAIPFIVRFIRSPRGQALVRQLRNRVDGSGGKPRR